LPPEMRARCRIMSLVRPVPGRTAWRQPSPPRADRSAPD
jgi:hypothetical protein